MTSDRLRVGFIGLGAMGLPMATRLVAAGETLVVARDVSGPRFAAVASAERAATFRELAAKCPVVLLSLPDAAAVRAVLFGHHGVA